jgi:hypothetical protein
VKPWESWQNHESPGGAKEFLFLPQFHHLTPQRGYVFSPENGVFEKFGFAIAAVRWHQPQFFRAVRGCGRSTTGRAGAAAPPQFQFAFVVEELVCFDTANGV